MSDSSSDEYPELQLILSRISSEMGQNIGTGPGWYPIIVELDRQLAAIDPGYTVHQVKQKMSELRVYFEVSDTTTDGDHERMRALVRAAEEKAARTCELCGEGGRLWISRYGGIRTLCADCAAAEKQGYKAVRPLEAGG
ncbi:Uncharacterised protein [Mycobacteroides abscessus subsp. massiliense]|uniref:hypothetical protein n=1 Tax=Mycobacteroides abscessus TaxID=36809 RepID=UPI0009A64444|nr:hypothetical protein [Mycobacteroides abscessus]UEA25184.1 hypothetical protein LK464_03765 [Mycobacteroides abscessus subsp. abscessus]SLH42161.1 Uncharacterised protein [Mycobacteroides abscessus subsp. massiliense]